MTVNRMVKWAAAGIIAIAAVPAIGMARVRASLPTDAVTVTPTGEEAPLLATAAPASVTHRKVVRRGARKSATHRKVSTRKRASAKHRKFSAHHRTHKASRHTKRVAHRPTRRA